MKDMAFIVVQLENGELKVCYTFPYECDENHVYNKLDGWSKAWPDKKFAIVWGE